MESLVNQDDFWRNQEKAQIVLKELAQKKKVVELWQQLAGEITDLDELTQITDERSSEEILGNAQILAKKVQKAELELFLSDKYDLRDAILSISTGTGGTDAQDLPAIIWPCAG